MEKNKKKIQRVYKGDFCFKYLPRHSYSDFKQEINQTEGQLLEMLPEKTRAINKNFDFTKRNIAISYWVLNIGFVTFCHKIKTIKRIFSNQWAMFAFKIACVLTPAVLYIQLEGKSVQEHHARLFRMVEDQYRSYKNTGDIHKLNPEVQIYAQ